MKFGGRGPEYEKGYVLHELFERISEYILTTNLKEYAFRISRFDDIDEQTGKKRIMFTSNDIPIRETVYTHPKLDNIPFHSSKFTFKERIKILFKGRL